MAVHTLGTSGTGDQTHLILAQLDTKVSVLWDLTSGIAWVWDPGAPVVAHIGLYNSWHDTLQPNPTSPKGRSGLMVLYVLGW